MVPPPDFRRARRAEVLQLSEIVRINEAANAMRANGQDVLSLVTGEPDFPTPAHVIAATSETLKVGRIPYPPTQGIRALREAICAATEAGCGFSVPLEQVIVSSGAKQVICNAMEATLDPGDGVIVPAPYWSSYADSVAFAGGRMPVVPCEEATGFTLQPEALRAAITSKTRWLILNSPCHPSGKRYSAEELRALADVLGEHPQVWVLTDEIYQHIAFAPFHAFRAIAPDLAGIGSFAARRDRSAARTPAAAGRSMPFVSRTARSRRCRAQRGRGPLVCRSRWGVLSVSGLSQHVRPANAGERAHRRRCGVLSLRPRERANGDRPGACLRLPGSLSPVVRVVAGAIDRGLPANRAGDAAFELSPLSQRERVRRRHLRLV